MRKPRFEIDEGAMHHRAQRYWASAPVNQTALFFQFMAVILFLLAIAWLSTLLPVSDPNTFPQMGPAPGLAG